MHMYISLISIPIPSISILGMGMRLASTGWDYYIAFRAF